MAVTGWVTVGQFAIQSAWMLGASRVILISACQSGWRWPQLPERQKRSISRKKRCTTG